ncbi:MAG: hypothetical protein AAF950_17145 [Pseudomonadota bacterium]
MSPIPLPSKDNMDVLSFFASVIESLAWPAALVICALTFRTPILKLLSSMRSLKYGDFEVDFGEELTDIEASIDTSQNGSLRQQSEVENTLFRKRAEISPRGAVIEAWLSVEQPLFDFGEFHEISHNGRKVRSPRTLILELAKREIISTSMEEQLLALLNLRNQAAHMKDNLQITPMDAIRYKDLADRLRMWLEEHPDGYMADG